MRHFGRLVMEKILFRWWHQTNQVAMSLLISASLSRWRGEKHPQVVGVSTVVPYGSFDCAALFTAIAKLLGSVRPGQIVGEHPPIELHRERQTIKYCGVYSWSEKVQILREIFPSPDLWRGAIDQYKRNCEAEEFFTRSRLNFEIFEQMNRDHLAGIAISERSSLVIITDLAYVRNRTIVDHARQIGTDVLMVNPFGYCERLDLKSSFTYGTEFRGSTLADLRRVIAERAGDCSIEQMLHDRFEGRSLDFNIRLSNFSARFPEVKETGPATTVFLHAIRDAAIYNPVSCSPGCEDSFSWAREVIGHLTDHHVNFRVRRHPMAFRYPDETAIVDRLMHESLISPEMICSRPTLHAIDTSGCITTLAGTVTLEAVARRKPTLNFSSLYPPDVGLRVDVGNLADRVVGLQGGETEVKATEWARAALVLLELPRLRDIRPHQPMMPSLSYLERFAVNFTSGWALTRNLMTRSGSRVLLDQLHAVLSATGDSDPED